MRILFMHNNFPGQYKRIFNYLQQFKGYKLGAVTLETNKQKFNIPKVTFKPHRKPSDSIHHSLRSTEEAVINGQSVYKALMPMKQRGESPDIILSHSGWGNSLFIKDVFPDAKLLSYYEWYYICHGGDGEFFRDEPYGPNDEIRIRMKNTPILQDLAAQDWGQSPTKFQHSRFPKIFQDRISVLHDGVDTEFFSPGDAKVKLPSGKTLTADDEVITYVARGMEEYRGFPQFMRVVERLQKERPNLQVLILGNDRVAYGSQKEDGKGLKNWAMTELDLDMDRTHFLGLKPLGYLRDMMRITTAHIYLTAPFVLSWSMMETMSAGALIVGSATEPVEEMIQQGENGLLVPFFDEDKLFEQVMSVLKNPSEFEPLRQAARQSILDSYSVRDLLPQYRKLIDDVASGKRHA